MQMLPKERDIKRSSSSLKQENKQTKTKETTGQLPILECCKQLPSSSFLVPKSKTFQQRKKQAVKREEVVIKQLCDHLRFSCPIIILLEDCITVLFSKKIKTAQFICDLDMEKARSAPPLPG